MSFLPLNFLNTSNSQSGLCFDGQLPAGGRQVIFGPPPQNLVNEAFLRGETNKFVLNDFALNTNCVPLKFNEFTQTARPCQSETIMNRPQNVQSSAYGYLSAGTNTRLELKDKYTNYANYRI